MIFSAYFSSLRAEPRMFLVYLGLFGIAVVPFLSIYRVGPQSGFFLESGSLLWILAWALSSAYALRQHWGGYFYQSPIYYLHASLRFLPFSTWWLLALAVYWVIQARILNLSYLGMSDMVAGAFFIYALLACACRVWVNEFGQERIVRILAWVLLIGAVIQAFIGWLQYGGWASHFNGILMYRHGIVEGQLGQRNHFAHYLMWGVLATTFLWSQRQLSWHRAGLIIIFLAATMGLTGSRTIFAYLFGVAIWSALWLFGGRSAWRNARCFFIALGLVLLMQFTIEPLLSLLGNSNLDGAAERLSQHQFGQSGRDYEWRKAWQLFLNKPFLGYGWGSYPLQSFLLNIYPTGFRPYETNVLFTHSHNSFLNLLAEMGLIGLLMILGGLAYIIQGCLKKKGFENSPANLFLLSVLTVSMAHSFFEYPLWYFYFLSVVMVVIFLLDYPRPQRECINPVHPFLARLNQLSLPIFSILCVVALIVLVNTMFSYQQLRSLAIKSNSVHIQQKQVEQLLQFAQHEHLLRYYAEFVLTSYIDVQNSHTPSWALPVAKRANQYRPFSSSYKWALLAYRQGDIHAAESWIEQLYQYYPSKINGVYAKTILDNPYYIGLHKQHAQWCQRYQQTLKTPVQCQTSLYAKP